MLAILVRPNVWSVSFSAGNPEPVFPKTKA